MFNTLRNEKGLTLLEILAVIVVSSIILIATATLVVQAMKNFERTSIEMVLRDEADLLMAQLVKDLFVLKSSDISTINCSTTTLCEIALRNGQSIGFDGNHLVTRTQEYFIENKDVDLKLREDAIQFNRDEGTIKVTFTLLHKMKQIETTFQNEVSIIRDLAES